MAEHKDVKQLLLNELSKEPAMVLETAYLFARTYVDYGEDITKAWVNASQQTSILRKVYEKGYADAIIVESTREKGKWIDKEKIVYPICSKCGLTSVEKYSFCPNCGAEMGSEDGSN